MGFCTLASLPLFFDYVRAIDIAEYAPSSQPAARTASSHIVFPRIINQRQDPTEFCRAFPGDEDWPGNDEWASFNQTLGGALIKPVPRAAVCHNSWSQYDSEKCKDLILNYNNHEEKISHPTDVIYPYFQGETCLPTSNASSSCVVGGDPAYVVNATSAAQISAGLKFAKDKNLRLIVKNTGHDVLGKSTGAGSLSIWTHNMKQIDWLPNYESEYYRGPAIRVGAGVTLGEYYQAAENHEVTVVGGECSTVGVAGGYIAGGGHSPIGGLFGMGADNVVELTAVLPNGTHVNISSKSTPEMFWAFRGGGGSTFGVVTSLTVKAHPKIHTTISTWTFSTINSNITDAIFWEALRAYLEHMPAIADSGSQGFTTVSPANDGLTFNLTSFVAPNMTVEDFDTLMEPYFIRLQALGISSQRNTTFHESYFGGWQRAFPKITAPYDPNRLNTATGSRLLPRKNFEDPGLLNQTLKAMQKISSLGQSYMWYAQNNRAPPSVDNAIVPAYRTSGAFLITHARFPMHSPAEANAARNKLTKIVVPILKEISPGGGTYMNEADVREDAWQDSFFGSHYPRLLKLKNELDPDRLLWGKTAVGSEDWYIRNDDGLPEVGTGRLCRKEARTKARSLAQVIPISNAK